MNTDLNKELIDAIRNKQDLPYIQSLVAQGADINAVDVKEIYYTPNAVINFAAGTGNLELVKWLDSQGAKPFIYKFFNNHEYYTQERKSCAEKYKFFDNRLMDSALESGSIELVEWLLEQGTDISEIYLSNAAASKSLPLVKWLVEEKGISTQSDQYVLADAVPSHEMINWLFDNGAKLSTDITFGKGFYEMSLAVADGDLALIQLFVSKGAELGSYMMDSAIRSGHVELMEWLKEQGVKSYEKLYKAPEVKPYIEIDLQKKFHIDKEKVSPNIVFNPETPATQDNQKEYAMHYILKYKHEPLMPNEFNTRAFLEQLNFKANSNSVISILIDERHLDTAVDSAIFDSGYVNEDGFPLSHPLKVISQNSIDLNSIFKKKAGESLTETEIKQINKPILWPEWNDNCFNLQVKCISYKIYMPKNNDPCPKNSGFFIGGQGSGVTKAENIITQSNFFYKGDLNYEISEKIIAKGSCGKIVTKGNMYLSSPTLNISEGAELKSDGNMYLFNVQNIECINSKIVAGNDLYLPNKNLNFNNCNIISKNAIYIDSSNRSQICNEVNYESFEPLRQYCSFSGEFNSKHNIISYHEEL